MFFWSKRTCTRILFKGKVCPHEMLKCMWRKNSRPQPIQTLPVYFSLKSICHYVSFWEFLQGHRKSIAIYLAWKFWVLQESLENMLYGCDTTDTTWSPEYLDVFFSVTVLIVIFTRALGKWSNLTLTNELKSLTRYHSKTSIWKITEDIFACHPVP